MNGCCLVETRVIGNLQDIIQQKHLNFIPRSWGLTLFLSEANKHLIHADMFDREVKIFYLPEYFPAPEYNKLLTSADFWSKLSCYDKVLIFQTDSELLRPGIEDFLQWSFIGAPDSRKECEGMMNGGLSLRDVEHHKIICNKYTYDGVDNEDWWFCKKLRIEKRCTPVSSHAKLFSIELDFSLDSLGCHAIEKYLTKEECKQIREQYK
jgi:hypothetical protein